MYNSPNTLNSPSLNSIHYAGESKSSKPSFSVLQTGDSTKSQLKIHKTLILLISAVFTILQHSPQIFSKIPYLLPILLLVSSIGVGYIYYINLPFDGNLYDKKLKLVFKTIYNMAKNTKLDLWNIILIILLVSWLFNVWRSLISFFVWCAIIWVYNLEESKENIAVDYSSRLTMIRGEELKFYSILENRIKSLEKEVSYLENEKIRQNISIYTIDHNINEKIGTIEKYLFEKEKKNQDNLEELYLTLQNLKKKKTKRTNVFKMYIKIILKQILTNRQVSHLKKIEYFLCLCIDWIVYRKN